MLRATDRPIEGELTATNVGTAFRYAARHFTPWSLACGARSCFGTSLENALKSSPGAALQRAVSCRLFLDCGLRIKHRIMDRIDHQRCGRAIGQQLQRRFN